MPIWSLSSRRCSTVERAALVAVSLSLAVGLSSGSGWCDAAPAPVTAKRPLRPVRAPLLPPPSVADLRLQIGAVRDGSFGPLLLGWKRTHGASLSPRLFEIASLKGATDGDRYVALLGAARLGGRPVAPRVASYLRDRSWVIRSAALRALEELRDPAISPQTLPLLRDPALAVRLQAVNTIEKLHPDGAPLALVEAALASENYRGGRPQWVPERALSALITLRGQARGVAPRLKPLLDRPHGPDFQSRVVATLDAIEGRRLKPTGTLAERVKAWRAALWHPITTTSW